MKRRTSEPPIEFNSDHRHFKIFPKAQIIRIYRRYIKGNQILHSSKPIESICAADFKHNPEALESLKAWINTFQVTKRNSQLP